jgi:hypothetical protein
VLVAGVSAPRQHTRTEPWTATPAGEVGRHRSGTRTTEHSPEPVVTPNRTRTLLSDRTGLLGAAGGLLAGLAPAAVYGYPPARLPTTVPAGRGASPTQKIGLIRGYLTGANSGPSSTTNCG